MSERGVTEPMPEKNGQRVLFSRAGKIDHKTIRNTPNFPERDS